MRVVLAQPTANTSATAAALARRSGLLIVVFPPRMEDTGGDHELRGLASAGSCRLTALAARCTSVAVLSFALALAAALAGAPVPPEPPFDAPGRPLTAEMREVPMSTARVDEAPYAYRAYQLLSRFDGPRCPHRPSCSAYALQAVRRHGVVLGAFATVGRLLRGRRSSALRPLPRDADGLYLDPLEASTSFLGR
jgi:hypothetical protein